MFLAFLICSINFRHGAISELLSLPSHYFMPMELLSYLLAFGVFQGLFLVVIIMMADQNKSGKTLLVLLITCLVFRLAEYLVKHLGAYEQIPQIIFTTIPGLLLIGPLSYLYLKQHLYDEIPINQKSNLFHLLPFLLFVAIMIPFYLTPPEGKIYYVNALAEGGISNKQIFYFVLFFTQFHSYMFFNLRMLSEYMKAFKAIRSDTAFLKIDWLRKLLYSIVVFTGMYVLTYAFLFFKNTWYPIIEQLAFIAIVLVIHLIFIYFMKYKFGSYQDIKIQKPKYHSSSLDPKDIKKLLDRLEQLMLEKQPFLDADLRINHLAELLDVPVPHVSQVINEGANKSFYDFVNAYRIEKAKKLLFDPQYAKYTMMGVAYDAGFSNKTTFNRTFKKHVGMTPTAYVKKSGKTGA